MGRHIRRLSSEPNLICPNRVPPGVQSSSHGGLITYQLSPTLRLFFLKNLVIFLLKNYIHTESCLRLLVRDMQVLYTNFFVSRQKSYWYFVGLNPTPLVTPNSDSAEAINNCFYYDPTHTLLLLAIAKALRLRFGVPPSPSITSRLLKQTTIRRYPYFVCPDLFIAPQLAGSAILH